jgi:hypothetical protein
MRAWFAGIAVLVLTADAFADGTMALTPSPTTFPVIQVGSGSVVANVTIDNTDAPAAGTSILVTEYSITGADANQFRFIDHGCTGQSCTLGTPFTVMAGVDIELVGIACQPTSPGLKTATFTVTGNHTAGTNTVTLNCTATAPVIGNPVPASRLVAFGDVHVDTPSTTQTVSIDNTGNAALSVSSVAIIGTHASDFSIVSGMINLHSVAPGDTDTWTVRCTPSALGARMASLRISSDGFGTPAYSFSLTCNGAVASFVVDTPSVNFGTVPVGSFVEQTVRITNNGPVFGVVQMITSGNSAFTFTVTGGPAPRTLAMGEFIDIVVRFTPVNGNVVMASLTIATDGDPPALVVPLTGDGLFIDVDLTIQNEADAMIDLGNVRVGTTATRLVTVTNTGETNVTLATPASDNARCAIQLVSPATLPAVIAPAGMATFEIRTTPNAVGAGTRCTITVSTNIPSTDTILVDYIGIAPEVEVVVPTNAAIAFGVVDVDAGLQMRTVVLKNTGSDVLAIGGCAVTGSTRFMPLTNCAQIAPIAVQASATLAVGYDPAIEANDSAQLKITVDALSTSEITINLTGTGADQRIAVGPSTVDFPDTAINPMPPPNARIMVHNPMSVETGTGAPLVVSMVSTNESAFEVTNPGPFTIDAGGMIEVAVLFRPTRAGEHDGTLVIQNDTTATPAAQVVLRGRGIGEPTTETAGCCQSGGDPVHGFVVLAVGFALRRRRRR